MLETLQGDRFSQEKLTVGIWKIFSKCLVRSLSACQTMTNTCIVFRIKMVDIYIALRSYVADELDIVTIWCFMFSSSYKPHLKIEAYVDRKKGQRRFELDFRICWAIGRVRHFDEPKTLSLYWLPYVRTLRGMRLLELPTSVRSSNVSCLNPVFLILIQTPLISWETCKICLRKVYYLKQEGALC